MDESNHGDHVVSGQLKIEFSIRVDGRVSAVNSMLDWIKQNWQFVVTPLILGTTLIYTVARDLVGTVRWKRNRKLEFSKPRKPTLPNSEHSDCVIFFEVINRSEGKAFIESVRAFDDYDNKIGVSYATEIDHCGNPVKVANLVEITNSTDLYIQPKDGRLIDYMRLEVKHSFSKKPGTVIFDISDLLDE